MKNKRYLVCRDNVYVGEVIKPYDINRYNEDFSFLGDKYGQLYATSWVNYRSMLFALDENKLSNDLLYDSPLYPILNITDDRICLDCKENDIVIKRACNLSMLLKYFGYDEYLTYDDIVKIRKTFFTSRFANDNCRLFGFKEVMAGDLKFYSNGIEVTDSKEIERRQRMFKNGQKMGHRMFIKISDSAYLQEYFNVLNDMGDNSLFDVINFRNDKINVFVPDAREGKIRKLKK